MGELTIERDPWAVTIATYASYMVAAGWSTGTVRVKSKYLRRLQRATGHLSPWMVTPDELLTFMANPDWSPETRKSARSSIATFYEWAFLEGRIEQNPAARLPKVRVPESAPRPAPDDALKAALDGSDTRTRLMLLLAAHAGLRRAEIAGIHTSHVEGSSLRVRGKGGKTRVIPVHPEVAEYLQGLPEGYVFPGKDGGHLSPDRVGRIMSDALGPGWTAHTLRHRFASKGYAAGDLFTLQQLMGHANPATTRRYTALPPESAMLIVMAS